MPIKILQGKIKKTRLKQGDLMICLVSQKILKTKQNELSPNFGHEKI
jgi:hypothetical protein